MRQFRSKAVTLAELITVGMLIAALCTGALYYTANYITWAKTDAKARQIATLNRALEEYRLLGGINKAHSLGGANTPTKIAAVIDALKTGFTSDDGKLHNFLANTGNIDVSKLSATKTGRAFIFTTLSN